MAMPTGSEITALTTASATAPTAIANAATKIMRLAVISNTSLRDPCGTSVTRERRDPAVSRLADRAAPRIRPPYRVRCGETPTARVALQRLLDVPADLMDGFAG